MRDLPSVTVALPTAVSSPCPLLADERADTLCPVTGIHVPQCTAWVPAQLDLSHFVGRNGDICLAALEKALIACVDRGDRRHDLAAWDSPALHRDSRLNRRLAIAIRGWGCITKLRGDNPQSLTTLRKLEELAAFATATLAARSRALAKERGHCPALDAVGEHIAGSSPEIATRWRRAVSDSAIRHRNLLLMSPWDVFPAGQPADCRYLDLLPLLRCANSLSFRRGVDIRHWSLNEFRGFYERVGAILQAGSDAGLIAKQV